MAKPDTLLSASPPPPSPHTTPTPNLTFLPERPYNPPLHNHPENQSSIVLVCLARSYLPQGDSLKAEIMAAQQYNPLPFPLH